MEMGIDRILFSVDYPFSRCLTLGAASSRVPAYR
jgi:hypothetical protein